MNTFILRWNPAISSYKMTSHLDIVSHVRKMQFPNNFNWSVREWENLKKGDAFILLQVGTDADGIAMIGRFISIPYEEESWREFPVAAQKLKDGVYAAYGEEKAKAFLDNLSGGKTHG